MKKLLALILCLSMTLGTVAFAAETELNKDVLEGQTTVSLTIDPAKNEFVVVIPSSVTIDPETKEGSFDVVLKAGWKLVSSNGLKVTLKEFANGVFDGVTSGAYYPIFTLKSSEGNTVSYELNLKSNTSTGHKLQKSDWNKAKVIEVVKSNSNTKDQIATLTITVPTLPKEPGEYSDIITFAVSLY